MPRTLISLALLLLACSSSLFADDRWRISILASEISFSGNDPWSDDAHGGVGVGIAYIPKVDWDVELTVSSQTYRGPYTRLFFVLNPDGTPGTIPGTELRRYRVTPIDVSVTRHFLSDQPITPYVRAGVRYVDAPQNTPSTFFISPWPIPIPPVYAVPVQEGFGLHDRTSAQAGAGARIRLTPRTALRAEVNRLLRSKGADFDPLTRYAVGLSWVF